MQGILNPDQENLDLANVNLMLELLVQKKKQLEAVSLAVIVDVLCFLLSKRVLLERFTTRTLC